MRGHVVKTDHPDDVYVETPHAPPHLFRPGATYFVTAKTLDGAPFMAAPERRGELLDALRFAATERRWSLLAWVVLTNHYHCLLKAPEDGASALR